MTPTSALPVLAPDARAQRVPQAGDAPPAQGGASFADMLRQRRGATPPDDPPAPPADAGASPVIDAVPVAALTHLLPKVAIRPTVQVLPEPTVAETAERPLADLPATPAVEPAPETKAARDADSTVATPAELRDWLAALPLDAMTQRAAAPRPAGESDPAGKTPLPSARAVDTRLTGDAPAAAAATSPAAPAAPASVAPPEALFVRAAQAEPPAKAHDGAAPVAAGLPPATPALRTDAPAAPVQAAIAPPLHSPAFAPALAAQVSILARDGVLRAELQLNPAEMGPISVQISIDGSDARVSFGANLGATRDAIERSLPDLAAALRSEGLSFSGGGVSDQASQPRQALAQRSDGFGIAPGAADAAPAPRAALPRAREGLLDLYA